MQIKRIHPFKLRTLILSVVIFTVTCSLLVTGLFISRDIIQNQRRLIKEQVLSIAKIVRQSDMVRSQLNQNIAPHKSTIDTYTTKIQKATKVDFVVVLNQKLIRYSHPDKAQIGKKFSSPVDAAKSLHGKSHYSNQTGILGPGYRIFMPIYNNHGKQIGIICVGLTDKSINTKILDGLHPIIFGSLLGLILGIIAASLLAFYIRKILLGMEPTEIATKVTELSAINDSMAEGLVAIDPQHRVLTANDVAMELLPNLKEGQLLDNNIYKLLFNEDAPIINQSIIIGSSELIVSSNQLHSGRQKLGSIALLRDRSDYEELANQLAGTQQYIQSLRAQEHEFLNKLQAISGLIELQEYDKVQNFISTVNKNYQEEFGNINHQIQFPALAGFLLGKMNQANEQGMHLIISEDSHLDAQVGTEQLSTELIKVLGNLIDNAIDAIITADNPNGEIKVAINFDEESQTIVLEVADNGTGTSEDVKEHLLKGRYTTKGEGHGYGLSLINSIVRKYDGYIDISDNLPNGTIVYVELPLNLDKGSESV